MISVIISANKTPGFQFTFHALDLYRKNAAIFGLNSLSVSFADSVRVLGKLKEGFESGALKPPPALEETDLADAKGVLAAYEKVEAGAKAKQVLVNKNV
jgi:hypothetical protein